MLTRIAMVTKTSRAVVRLGWVLALVALLYSIASITIAYADGPADTWQPSAAYLAARARLMNSKARQLGHYMDAVERRGSGVAPGPWMRYKIWKDHQVSLVMDGSWHAPSGAKHK